MAALVEKLAAFFKAQPNVWHDGKTLADVAGYAGYRSRISELRQPPFSLQIDNRIRRIAGPNGKFTRSEYRYVPSPPCQSL